jgi:aminopeptidase N
LAAFAKTPNLDEHFTSAVFFFSDDTAEEVLAQLKENPRHSSADEASKLAEVANPILRADSSNIDVRLAGALLDNHRPSHGFFYAMVDSHEVGAFDLVYEPDAFEPITVGTVAPSADGTETFQIWTSFRQRHAPAFNAQPSPIQDVRVRTDIHADLSMSCEARFQYMADEDDGRVVALRLASRLRVTSANIDGKPAEVFQHQSPRNTDLKGASEFLVLADSALVPNQKHQIEVRYDGSIVHRTANGGYFVDERNTWYPFIDPMLATFDLTFRFPENLSLVSTGEPVDEHIAGGIRTIHRKTPVKESLAGFNLGEYNVASKNRDGYHVEIFSGKNGKAGPTADLSEETAEILHYYSDRWGVLPIHTLAVSPIDGYFGQGFPGLIYLSSIAYLPEENRPEALRNLRSNTFFSQVLLPHEIAHQWWGNIVSQADYRTGWLIEAMAEESALEFLDSAKGPHTRDAILRGFRGDLASRWRGQPIESAGPVDFGERLLNNCGVAAWSIIVYEKGAWILQMLRERLGNDGFLKLQQRMLQEYRSRPIGNDDFRRLAAEFTRPGQPDRSLTTFFDTWVMGTGIPRMKLAQATASLNLKLSGVDQDFIADVPLRCKRENGTHFTRWVSASSGDNFYDLPPGARNCALPAATDFLYIQGE